MQCTFDQIARVMAVYKANAVADFAMNVNLGTHKSWQNHQVKQHALFIPWAGVALESCKVLHCIRCVTLRPLMTLFLQPLPTGHVICLAEVLETHF